MPGTCFHQWTKKKRLAKWTRQARGELGSSPHIRFIVLNLISCLPKDESILLASSSYGKGLAPIRHGSIVELPMPTRFTRRQLSMVGASALGASATAAPSGARVSSATGGRLRSALRAHAGRGQPRLGVTLARPV